MDIYARMSWYAGVLTSMCFDQPQLKALCFQLRDSLEEHDIAKISGVLGLMYGYNQGGPAIEKTIFEIMEMFEKVDCSCSGEIELIHSELFGDVSDVSIEELDVSAASYNAFRRNGYVYISEFLSLSYNRACTFRGLTASMVSEVYLKINKFLQERIDQRLEEIKLEQAWEEEKRNQKLQENDEWDEMLVEVIQKNIKLQEANMLEGELPEENEPEEYSENTVVMDEEKIENEEEKNDNEKNVASDVKFEVDSKGGFKPVVVLTEVERQRRGFIELVRTRLS